MAYSTLISLEIAINQILNQDRFSIPSHENKQIISLDKYAIFFQAFLEDFPEKAKILEARIRDVAIKAEDIMEWFFSKQIRYSYGYTKRIPVLRQIMFKYRLHKIRVEMDSIAAKVVEIQNSVIIKDNQLDDYVGATSSSQVADIGKTNIVGFNEDLIEIKEKLCGWAPQLQVLPILGMGGIGKTTLARYAYDDQLIIEHFQIRAWVTISQDHSQLRILLDLLDSMKEFNPDWRKEPMVDNSTQCNTNEMALKIHKILTGRRFLIVMDDIWSTKVLDDVKHLFPNYNNGSRIMITTRLAEVARYANSSILPHEMRLMDADQSWNLLRQKVFIHRDRVPHELESIGRDIARSCGGLPLAITVIAGLLSTASKTLTSWKEIARNIRSSIATTDGQIEKILSLSYNHLPHHLRPCFLYMGGFPQDHEIKVTILKRLWIAESFIKPVVSKEFEGSAEEYLNDLVDRSLVVVTKRKPNGKIKCCSLHDLVREMCIKISREEKFLVEVKGSGALKLLKSMKDKRRISIYHSDLSSLTNSYSSTIRSLIYLEDTLDSFKSFKLLRVLDLLRARYHPHLLSDQLFKLFHLRYLAFWYSHKIPRTISNLQSLQTLIIKDLRYSRLPYEIWSMHQLRHLIISDCRLPDTNAATSALENLQTLGVVENLICLTSTLKLIPNLTKLGLTYSSERLKPIELLFHNFVHLSRLEKLQLELRQGWHSSDKPNLVVPSSLKELTLIGWGNEEPYLDIDGPFPNLQVLKLKKFDFKQGVWRSNDEDFLQLKFLLFEDSNLRQWETDSCHFPRHISSCLDLNKIPDCIGEIPTLELIELKRCTESLADSAKGIQEEARSCDDDAFEVLCIDCTAVEEEASSEFGARKLRLRRRHAAFEGPNRFK